MRVLLAVLLSAGFAGDQAQSPTLREVLAKHQIKADDFADADRQITSFAVQADRDWFAIAYYWHTGTDRLPAELRLRTWDRLTGRWRHEAIPDEARRGGSALEIDRRGSIIYLRLHVNPSAARTLVLNEELQIRRLIDGWPGLVLADGRLIYQNNIVHFAPYHPGAVSLYDPRSDRDMRLFPAAVEPYDRKPAIHREIGIIRQTAPDQITFDVREEDREWVDSLRMRPIAPERRLLVTCSLSGNPGCRSESK
jgi:hypothetical protein